jgi:hypothetical protein
VSCETNDTISKLFLHVITNYDYTTHPKKTKFELYIKEIYRCLLGNDFYHDSLHNLHYLKDNCFVASTTNKFSIYFQSKDQEELFYSLSSMIDESAKLNRDYSSYQISFQQYILSISTIIKDLRVKMEMNGHIITDINTKKICIDSSNINAKQERLQYLIPYTNIYSTLDEFVYYYSKSKKFSKKNNLVLPTIKDEDLEYLLKFIYYSFKKNAENFVLFSTIDSEEFFHTFFPLDSFFQILIVISDIYFPIKDSIVFNNHNFLLEILQLLIIELDRIRLVEVISF